MLQNDFQLWSGSFRFWVLPDVPKVTLGQNCVKLSDTALNNLLFQKFILAEAV